MQSDGNSCNIDTFREAITTELMISSHLENFMSHPNSPTRNPACPYSCLAKVIFFSQNLSKRAVHKL